MAETPPVMLITGSRKGLGRQLAELYVRRGYSVIGCSRSDTDLAVDGYHHYPADVADERAVLAMFRDIRKRFGRIDCLLNNAGIASMNHSLLTPGDTVTRVLQTNVVGTFLCTREAARLMKDAGAGRIVNFSSVAVPLQLPGESAYAASKAAVESLTRILAAELAPFGITVNAVGPTPVQTDLTRGIRKETMESLIARQPIPRWGEIDDIANVVDFFLKPESRFVTGQVLYLGGISR